MSGLVAGAIGGLADPRADRAQVAARLSRLGRRGRRLAFAAVLPGLGGPLADVYERAGALTYQPDYDRRPFRAPNNPALAQQRVLLSLVRTAPELVALDPDPVWLARWAGHLGAASWAISSQLVGWLLASAIDDGDEEVYELLIASIDGSDDVATMGRHVPIALLGAGRPDGWTRVEQLLLAAQRQEGLRQSILEVVDEAHPDAFRRMLALVLDNRLLRFSSVARAVGVWFGVPAFGLDRRAGERVLQRAVECLGSQDAARAAIAGGEPVDAYVGLWALATQDVEAAIAPSEELLDAGDPELRFAAALLLAQTGVSAAHRGLVRALGDADLRVAGSACDRLARLRPGQLPADAADDIEALVARVSKQTVALDPIDWFGPLPAFRRETAAGLLFTHRDPPAVERVLPYAAALGTWDRRRLVDELGKGRLSEDRRAALLAFLGDASPHVREQAIVAAGRVTLTDDEALALEPLLRRKPGDLRRGVLELITRRGDGWTLAAAERLMAGSENERLAAIDLLRRLAGGGGARADVARARLAGLDADEPSVVGDAARTAVADSPLARLTEADAFGLLAGEQPTAGTAPRKRDFDVDSAAARRVVALLDALIAEHAEVEIHTLNQGDGRRVLLGAANHLRLHFHEEQLRRGATEIELPLRDLWTTFAATLPPDAVDPDGQQLLRAYMRCARIAGRLRWDQRGRFGADLGARFPEVVLGVLELLVYLEADEHRFAAALDLAEDELARLTHQQLETHHRGVLPGLQVARSLAATSLGARCRDLAIRHWRLERWLEEPPGIRPKLPGHANVKERPRATERLPSRAPDAVLVAAVRSGAATRADLLDNLAGARGPYWEFGSLKRLSSRRRRDRVGAPEAVAEVVEEIRERVVAIELTRGEAPTQAAAAVLALCTTGGLDVLVAALGALGRLPFVRGWASDGESRATVFSHMVAASVPGERDTPASFAEAVRAARIAPRRLRETACYAPQWAAHVEAALGVDGLADAVWWLHAHTRDDRWRVDQDLRGDWGRAVAERTALSPEQLAEGAVDVAWFQAVRERVGDEELDALLAAAKYGSTAGGHKRAELFARALRGDLTDADLGARIAKSRHQDHVRAIGLLRLPPAAAERDATILARYERLQVFRRGSRAFGRQRQASEGRATDIGMENLARTAGYADPLRLTWAMEAHATADLAGDGVTVEHDGATVNLRVDDDGRPVIAVARGDKQLKAVPAKLRKVPELKAITDRAAQLRRQGSRIKASLEEAMVRGDALTGAELATLHAHLLLWPALSRLVLVGDGVAGFPVHGGRALRDPGGVEHAVGNDEQLRIAHPVDLAALEWPAWQRHVLAGRVVQPFKQVFRELYVPVAAEQTDGGASRRYAGHQLQPGRARALLVKRGWRVDEYDGVRKIEHRDGLIASLSFLDGFGSPVDVEPPTLEDVHFHHARTHDRIVLADVPPRVFSEVMRDIDLVVSVAHVAGVDPEASQSSLELRGALVSETCDLLGLDNVALDGPRALITGEIGRYSVHLGSANVHRLPGGSVCIVPVHSQARGRVFLPFADDDPRTAEIVAKVLMLARDRDIRDPTILEQLRA